jgi:hypothetical protein
VLQPPICIREEEAAEDRSSRRKEESRESINREREREKKKREMPARISNAVPYALSALSANSMMMIQVKDNEEGREEKKRQSS